jgi:hypothetical protein
MKKKIVITWVLVLSLVFCAVPAFAQYYPNREDMFNTKFPVRIIIIEQKGIRGQPYNLFNSNDSRRNYSLLSSELREKGYFDLIIGDELSTAAGCFIIFDSIKDPLSDHSRNYRLNENSKINVIRFGPDAVGIRTTRGELYYGRDIQASKLINFASYGIDETRVENWVKELRRDSRFNDKSKNEALVTEIINRKAAKQSFISGVSSLLPNQLAVPATLANTIVQWANQAEMAYAIACVYATVLPVKPTPNTLSDFKTDLIFLFAGEDKIKAALRDLSSRDITNSERTVIERAIGTYTMKERSLISEAALEKLSIATLQRLFQDREKLSLLETALSFVPVVNIFSAAAYSSSEARAFGERARKYYQRIQRY